MWWIEQLSITRILCLPRKGFNWGTFVSQYCTCPAHAKDGHMMFSRMFQMNCSLLTDLSNISKANIPWHVNVGRIEWQAPCSNVDLLTAGVQVADQLLACCNIWLSTTLLSRTTSISGFVYWATSSSHNNWTSSLCSFASHDRPSMSNLYRKVSNWWWPTKPWPPDVSLFLSFGNVLDSTHIFRTFLTFILHLRLITTPHVLYVHMTYVYSFSLCFLLRTITWPREVIIVLWSFHDFRVLFYGRIPTLIFYFLLYHPTPILTVDVLIVRTNLVRVFASSPINPDRLSNQCCIGANRCTPTLPR